MRNIIKKSLVTISFLFTGSAFALCPPPEKHWVALKCNPGEVFFIDPSSNYAKESMQFVTDIMLTGEQIRMAISEGTDAQIKSFQEQVTILINNMIKMQQIKLKDRLAQDKALRELKMNYEANIAEEQVRQNNATLFKDDTKEEIDLIVEILDQAIKEYEEDGSTLPPVPSITVGITEQYDIGGKEINVAIKAAEGVCEEDQIKLGFCSVPRKITPGKKLAKYFKACTEQKKQLVRKKQEAKSRTHGIVVNSKKTSENVNASNSLSEMTKNIRQQTEQACTPTQYKNKVCAADLTKEEFQEKVALNHIIPNGHVSPSNLLDPTFYGGEDLRDYDLQTKQDLIDKSLSKEEVLLDPEQSAVPIVKTYKNTAQYAAALHFVDNVTGDTLVSNQQPEDRLKQSSAEFQTLYNKRVAMLSLVRSSFIDSIKQRTGQKITEVVSNTDINNIEEPIKESVLGASELDILINKVDEIFSVVAVKAEAGIGETNSIDDIENGSERLMKKAQLNTLKLQVEIALKELFENEKIELLKAAQISSLVNSPEMVNYLKNLRR
jgi:hypothetical protein